MELLDRLIKFATLRPRSEFEVKRWFARKKINEKDAESALGTLKKTGVVDDEAFSHWWIEQRIAFRPKSQYALKAELVKHGVGKELAGKVVAESNLSDETMAFQLIEKKKRSWNRLDPETRKKKITNLLSSRGFGWSVIRRIINN